MAASRRKVRETVLYPMLLSAGCRAWRSPGRLGKAEQRVCGRGRPSSIPGLTPDPFPQGPRGMDAQMQMRRGLRSLQAAVASRDGGG